MSTLETTDCTSRKFVPYSDAGAASDDALALGVEPRERRRRGWQDVIDRKLIEWGRDPSSLADEDVIAPSREIIALANRIAVDMRNMELAPPARVVPNGDGGIVFEWWDGPVFRTVEISEDGSVESAVYEHHHLIETQYLSLIRQVRYA